MSMQPFEPKYKNYRVCYEGGNSKIGKEIYELYKYCQCDACRHRFKTTRGVNNKITVTTKDIRKVDDIAEFLKNWRCGGGNRALPIVYLNFDLEKGGDSHGATI